VRRETNSGERSLQNRNARRREALNVVKRFDELGVELEMTRWWFDDVGKHIVRVGFSVRKRMLWKSVTVRTHQSRSTAISMTAVDNLPIVANTTSPKISPISIGVIPAWTFVSSLRLKVKGRPERSRATTRAPDGWSCSRFMVNSTRKTEYMEICASWTKSKHPQDQLYRTPTLTTPLYVGTTLALKSSGLTFCTNNAHLATHNLGYLSTQFPMTCAKTSEAIVIDRPSSDAGMRVVGKRTMRNKKAANSVQSNSPDDIIS
jgi:hypothetical protein